MPSLCGILEYFCSTQVPNGATRATVRGPIRQGIANKHITKRRRIERIVVVYAVSEQVDYGDNFSCPAGGSVEKVVLNQACRCSCCRPGLLHIGRLHLRFLIHRDSVRPALSRSMRSNRSCVDILRLIRRAWPINRNGSGRLLNVEYPQTITSCKYNCCEPLNAITYHS